MKSRFNNRNTLTRCIIVTVALLTISSVHAGSEILTVRAMASGADRDEAIVQALGDALRQVHGGEITTRRETSMELKRIASNGESHSSHKRRTASSSSASSTGLISGYRIVSLKRDDYSGMHAILDVDVPVYRVSHIQANRKRIAVYPVEATRRGYNVAGTSLEGTEVAERLTQSMVSMLVQSRRFSVLDRDMRQAVEREHGFLGRADVPLAEKMAIGHTLGAELLLVTRLRELDATFTQKRNQYTGDTKQVASGSAVLEARVVMPSTGQLMWSRTVDLGANDFAQPMRAQSVLDTLARTLVQGLLEGIYPLRVVDGTGQSAVINQGGDIIQMGQRYEVYEIGRRISDPYNGESLGAREQRVAEVEIVYVGAKTSRVKVIEGRVDGDGQVLRILPSLAAGNPANRRSGGRSTASAPRPKICLPGDPC